MSSTQIITYSSILLFLILMAAFFSCAETALMAINRYRLRHRARMKKKSAMLILELLQRPDRLLGMILIGNNFLNILASAIATLIAMHYWGEQGVLVSTIVLTFLILVFAEVAPKTVAAVYPEKISRFVALPIFYLLKIFYPFVWLINWLSNGVLRLLHIKIGNQVTEPLSREELRTVVHETAGRISHPYKTMLLGILDLNKVTVEEVMIPRHEIIGIDLDEPWDVVQKHISNCQFDWIPVYHDNINQVQGILHLRDMAHLMIENRALSKEILINHLHETYFVPESTPLNVQLVNFQQNRKRLALVVDEYGEVQGLITLADILEEIVGEFTTNISSTTKVEEQPDGSYLVDGGITIREFNRITQWKFPSHGARTLSGLIVEYLEAIPQSGICVRIADHPMEILQAQENRVKIVRVFPILRDSLMTGS